ncbi:hypothetical protein [Flavobacterium sp.]|uniref:hypothetical protein n=1 Tax=Flavobacterium sp. TaxID=239 RepID=UPI00261C19A8|nr:hypothetical protein [Flavobacterium sp.]
MKKTISLILATFCLTISYAQEESSTENTGENFSLEGALAMFKNAKSLEEFEKLINEDNNNVNNLDLNNDGEIDYITVNDIKDGDTHVIVLSTFLGENEKQDVATIGIEKTGTEEAQLQIIGDENLYAENTIVEPFDVNEKAENSKGPNNFEIKTTRVIVNVWFWPSVRFIYAPSYVVWVSPYRWGFYPKWWKPWKPYRHNVFYGRCAPHRVYYHRTTTHRVVVARKVYSPRRNSSTLVVHNRKGTTVVHKNKRGKVKAVRVKKTRPVRARSNGRR